MLHVIDNFLKKFTQKFEANKADLFWCTSILIVTTFFIYLINHHSPQNIYSQILLLGYQLVSSILFIVLTITYTLANSFLMFKDFFQSIDSSLSFSQYQGTYWEDPTRTHLQKGPQLEDKQFQKIKDKKIRIEKFAAARVAYEEQDFKQWEKRNLGVNLDHFWHGFIRVVWILFFSAISFTIFYATGWLEYIQANSLVKLSETTVSRAFFTIPTALIGSLIAAPIVFIIWFFRDHNNRIQIESARKDTNLKDFQKLCEWASGFHLPENKNTDSSKTVRKRIIDGGNDELLTEEINSIETFVVPENSYNFTRRQGSEALQVSAVSQLEAFIKGKYGTDFIEPAFILLITMRNSIIKFIHHKNPRFDNAVFDAINDCMKKNHGVYLRYLYNQNKSINLPFLDINPRDKTKLNCSGLNFSNLDLRSCKLYKSNLVKCRFNASDLSNTNIRESNSIKSTFNNCSLNYCKFTTSNFNSCLFKYSSISNSEFGNIDLNNVEFSNCNLTNTKFRMCNITNSNFISSTFKQTVFEQVKINRNTHFYTNERDNIQKIEELLRADSTWDDDPEWLVGKIQDEVLLERIRKDYAKRQNYLKNRNRDWDAY